MPGPTDLEQLMLEYINDARLDPYHNAGRYLTSADPLTSSDPDIQGAINFFGVVGSAYYNAIIALPPVQPLAWNETLAGTARAHNAKMIAGDEQSHQVTSQSEADLPTRVTAAGYTWSAIGENVFAFAKSDIQGHAAFMIDWGGNASTNGMQSPPGHRNNIMGVGNVSSLFREIGIGITPEANLSTSVGPLVMTEDFGNRPSLTGPIILGVAYNDLDSNKFYTPGEGYANLTVSVAGGGNVTSWASGGYTLETTAGNETITFSGADLSGNVTVTTTLSASQNIKLDIIRSGNTSILATSTSVAARAIVVIRLQGWRAWAKEGLAFGLGALPAITCLVYFKMRLAPPNDLVTGQGPGPTLERLLTPSRYGLIASAFALQTLLIGPGIVVALAVYFFLLGRAPPTERRAGRNTAPLVLALGLAGYALIYLTTPNDLAWHLSVLDRLFMQVWPLALFGFFLAVASPEEALASKREQTNEGTSV